MQNLLGANPTADELKYMSLETQVTSQTPPSFLWQTVTDEVVPVENSYLFADACKKMVFLLLIMFSHRVLMDFLWQQLPGHRESSVNCIH